MVLAGLSAHAQQQQLWLILNDKLTRFVFRLPKIKGLKILLPARGPKAAVTILLLQLYLQPVLLMFPRNLKHGPKSKQLFILPSAIVVLDYPPVSF